MLQANREEERHRRRQLRRARRFSPAGRPYPCVRFRQGRLDVAARGTSVVSTRRVRRRRTELERRRQTGDAAACETSATIARSWRGGRDGAGTGEDGRSSSSLGLDFDDNGEVFCMGRSSTGAHMGSFSTSSPAARRSRELKGRAGEGGAAVMAKRGWRAAGRSNGSDTAKQRKSEAAAEKRQKTLRRRLFQSSHAPSGLQSVARDASKSLILAR